MADLLTNSAKEIRERLAQLEPMVLEHDRLTRALAALEEVLGRDGTAARKKGRAKRKPAPAGNSSRSASRGGRKGSGARRRRSTRAERFVALVEKYPGITVADAAKRLRTTPNSLYQVTSPLQKEGRVRKDGRGFHPAS